MSGDVYESLKTPVRESVASDGVNVQVSELDEHAPDQWAKLSPGSG
jgi:hypothetical protein